MDNTEILLLVAGVIAITVWVVIFYKLNKQKRVNAEELAEFRTRMDEKMERLNDKTFKSRLSVDSNRFGVLDHEPNLDALNAMAVSEALMGSGNRGTFVDAEKNTKTTWDRSGAKVEKIDEEQAKTAPNIIDRYFGKNCKTAEEIEKDRIDRENLRNDLL